jgi:hypothetical protein
MHLLHRLAAEQHELAAKAHRLAAEHIEKSTNDAQIWHAERALKYSVDAFRLATKAQLET